MTGHFNYISFGNWELVVSKVEKISIIRGRMFEYTPANTEKRLEDLGPKFLEFLVSLPKFLCSEHRQVNKHISLIIKFGRVSGITVQDGALP